MSEDTTAKRAGRRRRTTRAGRRRPLRVPQPGESWPPPDGVSEPPPPLEEGEAALDAELDAELEDDLEVEGEGSCGSVELGGAEADGGMLQEDSSPTAEMYVTFKTPPPGREEDKTLPRYRLDERFESFESVPGPAERDVDGDVETNPRIRIAGLGAFGQPSAAEAEAEAQDGAADARASSVVIARAVVIAPARVIGVVSEGPLETDGGGDASAEPRAARSVPPVARDVLPAGIAGPSSAPPPPRPDSLRAEPARAEAVRDPLRPVSAPPLPPIAHVAPALPPIPAQALPKAKTASDTAELDDGSLQLVDDESELAAQQQRDLRSPPPPPPKPEARLRPAPPPPAPPGPAAPPAPPAPAKRPPPPPSGSKVDEQKRKQARQWWERFFSDDYLMTVPPPSGAQIAKQVDFVEASLALHKTQSVLDVGCGLGLHAIELTRRGYLTVGLDLSLAMITRAAELAQEQNLKVSFVHADIREMEFDGAFDGAICMGTTFGFFDDDANRDVLARLHQALKPGGRLVLDVVNRDYVIKSQPNLVWFEGDECVCMEESEFNYFTSRLTVKRTMMREDGRQNNAEYTMRLYSLHELGQIVQQMGFRVLEVSGQEAVRGAFFGSHAPRILMLAERRTPGGRASMVMPPERGSAEMPRPSFAGNGDKSGGDAARVPVSAPPERAVSDAPKPPKPE